MYTYLLFQAVIHVAFSPLWNLSSFLWAGPKSRYHAFRPSSDVGEVFQVPVQMVCGFSLLNLCLQPWQTILYGCPVENTT